MQPVSSERSTSSATSLDTSTVPQTPTQHGTLHGDDSASGQLFGSEQGRRSGTPSEADLSSVSSGSSSRERRADRRRMRSNDGSPHGFANINRIDEYERAHIAASPKQDPVLFQVVPSKNTSNPGVLIQEFPNEVLTHLLSHLSPSSLSAMSLVSRRFHELITTPHAWRIAFSRYFPGPESLTQAAEDSKYPQDDQQISKTSRRSFSRLSALASWRSEYILRTRLLRSLARGKPAQFQSLNRAGHPRHGSVIQSTAVMTYGSGLMYPVSHLHATFGTGLNKKQPLFVHGANEQGLATASDPALGKIDGWGISDFQSFKHFADLYVGEAEYGLGPGDVVGMPNVMDLSQAYGKLYGEASPGGKPFFTAIGEQRGRYLSHQSSANLDLGIPDVNMIGCSVSSVWIAKSESILRLTEGVFGMLAGFSNGILCSYALGSHPSYNHRFDKGEPTAKWALSPGVPIIAIHIDEQYSSSRHSQHRIWAVVLNALGEVFYLTELPRRPDTKAKIGSEEIDRVAWETGRTVAWTLVEATRRVAKPDPFVASAVDGSYTPRSSPNSCGLGKEQIIAETKEIEMFLTYRPKHFRKICEGWDMRRKLLVDFASADDAGGGESIVVVNCGFEEGSSASIRRFMRRKFKITRDFDIDPFPAIRTPAKSSSLFGGPLAARATPTITPSPKSTPRSRTSSQDVVDVSCNVEWFISDFNFGGLRSCQVSATAIDESTYAVLTRSEDPFLGMNGGGSSASSPMVLPFDIPQSTSSITDIPGQRSRFVALGLTTGVVVLWNIRASVPTASDIINSVAPIRIIYTDSPQISCLALTSLYLVHGGSDGLVQAWDPLASTMQPVRTLNSRFSSRARRRLIQADMSFNGVGHNYYAAGAVILDPDPTVLRGMVGLGTHLRYWSYSSTAADQYKSSKRRLRRGSERGSNSAHNEQRFTSSGRGALKDYIANEKFEMEREKAAKRKEQEMLSGRFGTDLLGPDASEEEILAYATMLSEEAYSTDEIKRRGSSETSGGVSSASGETVPANDSTLHFDEGSSQSSPMTEPQGNTIDPDVAEAIRLSLLDQPTPAVPSPDTSTQSYYDVPSPARDLNAIPIRYGKAGRKQSRHPQPSSSSRTSSARKSPSLTQQELTKTEEEDDLAFALRLSLAEEESRKQQRQQWEEAKWDDESEYPELERNITARRDSTAESGFQSKGKGRADAW